jgi:hypothetical protein
MHRAVDARALLPPVWDGSADELHRALMATTFTVRLDTRDQLGTSITGGELDGGELDLELTLLKVYSWSEINLCRFRIPRYPSTGKLTKYLEISELRTAISALVASHGKVFAFAHVDCWSQVTNLGFRQWVGSAGTAADAKMYLEVIVDPPPNFTGPWKPLLVLHIEWPAGDPIHTLVSLVQLQAALDSIQSFV